MIDARIENQIAEETLTEERTKLRDQFAMAALTGVLVRYPHLSDAAEAAYKIADAMLEARDK